MYVIAGGTITHLFPQPAGPRLVLADDRLLVALYSPVNDELITLPGFEGSLQQVCACLWAVGCACHAATEAAVSVALVVLLHAI